jgi:hypothetical protein
MLIEKFSFDRQSIDWSVNVLIYATFVFHLEIRKCWGLERRVKEVWMMDDFSAHFGMLKRLTWIKFIKKCWKIQKLGFIKFYSFLKFKFKIWRFFLNLKFKMWQSFMKFEFQIWRIFLKFEFKIWRSFLKFEFKILHFFEI